jgi:hypothetical protein
MIIGRNDHRDCPIPGSFGEPQICLKPSCEGCELLPPIKDKDQDDFYSRLLLVVEMRNTFKI